MVVLVARFSPPALDGARRARVDTALERKCSKLAKAKDVYDATSALILASDDIAPANLHVVSKTVIAAIRARVDIPDMILLVETDRGLAWQLWIVKEGNNAYPAIEVPGPFEVPLDNATGQDDGNE